MEEVQNPLSFGNIGRFVSVQPEENDAFLSASTVKGLTCRFAFHSGGAILCVVLAGRLGGRRDLLYRFDSE